MEVEMDIERFAMWLRAELGKRGMPVKELERLSGVSDSTLTRILNVEVQDIKASVIASIAKVLGLEFWDLMQIAGVATAPGDPSAEALALAVTLQSQQDLVESMREVARLDPQDRDAVRAYMAELRRRRRRRHNAPRSAEEPK